MYIDVDSALPYMAEKRRNVIEGDAQKDWEPRKLQWKAVNPTPDKPPPSPYTQPSSIANAYIVVNHKHLFEIE